MGNLKCPVCDNTEFYDIREFKRKIFLAISKDLHCPICRDVIQGITGLHIHFTNRHNANEPIIGKGKRNISDFSSISDQMLSLERLEINDNVNNSQRNKRLTNLHQKSLDANRRCEAGTATMANETKGSKSQAQFNCDLCGLIFSSEHFLNLHKDIIHSNPNSFEISCKQCKRQLPNLEIYREHVKEAHSERRYVCDKCPKSFKVKGGLVIHQKMYHEKNSPSTCSFCNKTFTSKARKELHERRYHQLQLQSTNEKYGSPLQIPNESINCLGEAKTSLGDLMTQFQQTTFQNACKTLSFPQNLNFTTISQNNEPSNSGFHLGVADEYNSPYYNNEGSKASSTLMTESKTEQRIPKSKIHDHTSFDNLTNSSNVLVDQLIKSGDIYFHPLSKCSNNNYSYTFSGTNMANGCVLSLGKDLFIGTADASSFNLLSDVTLSNDNPINCNVSPVPENSVQKAIAFSDDSPCVVDTSANKSYIQMLKLLENGLTQDGMACCKLSPLNTFLENANIPLWPNSNCETNSIMSQEKPIDFFKNIEYLEDADSSHHELPFEENLTTTENTEGTDPSVFLEGQTSKAIEQHKSPAQTFSESNVSGASLGQEKENGHRKTDSPMRKVSDNLANRNSENKQWECEECRKSFTTKYFLKKHKRLHTGETPYCCEECGKTFTFQQSYHKHVFYHSDDKPHICPHCRRAFKEMSTLHNHIRIHTGEKPFQCVTCGKAFRQRVSYLVHQRIHTGLMPYHCEICNKSFRYKVSLRSHKCEERNHHEIQSVFVNLLQGVSSGIGNLVATTEKEDGSESCLESNSPSSYSEMSATQSTIATKEVQASFRPEEVSGMKPGKTEPTQLPLSPSPSNYYSSNLDIRGMMTDFNKQSFPHSSNANLFTNDDSSHSAFDTNERSQQLQNLPVKLPSDNHVKKLILENVQNYQTQNFPSTSNLGKDNYVNLSPSLDSNDTEKVSLYNNRHTLESHKNSSKTTNYQSLPISAQCLNNFSNVTDPTEFANNTQSLSRDGKSSSSNFNSELSLLNIEDINSEALKSLFT